MTIRYSWSDGDGRLIDINRVESTAVKVTRPPACTSKTHTPHPASGHGTYVLTNQWPDRNGVVLLGGLSLPFDHPERIQVGVEVRTGGGCAPLEERTASAWVTLLPPPAATPSPTAASPTVTP